MDRELVEQYIEQNIGLEDEFMAQLPREDQPLDDNGPDYINNNYEAFYEYACKSMGEVKMIDHRELLIDIDNKIKASQPTYDLYRKISNSNYKQIQPRYKKIMELINKVCDTVIPKRVIFDLKGNVVPKMDREENIVLDRSGMRYSHYYCSTSTIADTEHFIKHFKFEMLETLFNTMNDKKKSVVQELLDKKLKFPIDPGHTDIIEVQTFNFRDDMKMTTTSLKFPGTYLYKTTLFQIESTIKPILEAHMVKLQAYYNELDLLYDEIKDAVGLVLLGGK